MFPRSPPRRPRATRITQRPRVPRRGIQRAVWTGGRRIIRHRRPRVGVGFTLSTSAGQTVTVKEPASTTYQRGTSSASAGAITKGESVLVLGTTNGTTITAGQVTVWPHHIFVNQSFKVIGAN